MITQYYDLGEEWIEIEAIAKPNRPEYEKDVLVKTTAERVRPDGSKESVVINSNAVVGEPQPDGSMEPRGIDRNWLVTVKGIAGEYTEVSGAATLRLGKNPQRVSPRNFAIVRIWRDGTEYVVGGSNISRAEVLKIAESMF